MVWSYFFGLACLGLYWNRHYVTPIWPLALSSRLV